MLQVELSAPENTEDDRVRLLRGAVDNLRHIDANQQLVLLLEDLQDSDRGTRNMLV